MTTPYENATIAARDEITKLLRRFGCEHFATAAGRCSCAPARKAGLRCT
ncbi:MULTISPECIES: hypothetical protein [unclassified Bradyrhizobium]|nr:MULTISPECIES: hypothetical protein [unclassified Bradyrhizobium]WOH52777.1 hypothetical protein RX328_12080 [Bradyrhizobium sp. sBnM-33]